MPVLVVFTVTGFVAQIVNGSLGMGFGVISNTVLIAHGVAPAIASASVQMANTGPAVVSSISHTRFGNVSWPLVLKLGVPGAGGAFLGATLLSSLEGDWIVPGVAVLLLGLGVFVVLRSLNPGAGRRRPAPSGGGPRGRFLMPLGVAGGFMRAIGGAGWGPITTPTLLASGRIEPRYVIGSVSVAELFVTVSAMTGFLLGLSGDGGLDIALVLAMMAGGVVAAPMAAFVVSRIQPARLGVAVGSLVVMFNVRTLLVEVGAPGPVVVPVIGALAVTGVVLSARTNIGEAVADGSAGDGSVHDRAAPEVAPADIKA